MTSTAIVVFAKAPLPGLAKTRLTSTLGADGAARLADRLLRHALHQARLAGLGPVELCVTPDGLHPSFVELARQPGVELTLQADGDLGRRMAHAFERCLPRDGRVLLIGTDAPDLDSDRLRQAAAALDDHDAVFAPTFDGGYVLIGLRRPAPTLFTDMRWSHAGVMAETRHRLAAAGLLHHELPLLHDIDEAADLPFLPASWREVGGP